FTGVLIAAGLAVVGMWLERFIIVVTGLRVPLMPYEPSWYVPTWVEWSIMAGAFAMFGLVVAVFTKVVPVISIWEVAEQYEEGEAAEEVRLGPASGPLGVEGAAGLAPDPGPTPGGAT
ncbi:MAG: hypothetical protein HYX93_01615, partial [Chloroflexi bacterium]|nr:hypothetical protein [Chloroflexota bacterium]